jgi:hypothetical protein
MLANLLTRGLPSNVFRKLVEHRFSGAFMVLD